MFTVSVKIYGLLIILPRVLYYYTLKSTCTSVLACRAQHALWQMKPSDTFVMLGNNFTFIFSTLYFAILIFNCVFAAQRYNSSATLCARSAKLSVLTCTSVLCTCYVMRFFKIINHLS